MDKNCEGLEYLTWDQFDSPDKPGTGYKFMEREPVLILDKLVHRTKMILDIELAYVTPNTARFLSLPSNDSHRIGKAVRLRVLNPKKRMKVIRHLIIFGVKRINVDEETVYFDTDDQKPDWFGLGIWKR